ncbi:MAG TPA: TraK family protein [Thiolinea sp.]|nr:TraK family protein [Thiolinea sp.]
MTDLLEVLRNSAAENPEGRVRGAGLQFFLARKSEIAAAVIERWPYKEIYDALSKNEKKLPLSYRSFCTYIWRYITKEGLSVFQKSQPLANVSSTGSPDPNLSPKVKPENNSAMPRGYGNKPKYQGYGGDDDEVDISDLLTPVDNFTP